MDLIQRLKRAFEKILAEAELNCENSLGIVALLASSALDDIEAVADDPLPF